MMTAKAAHRKDLSGKPATMTHQHYRQIAAIIRKLSGEILTPVTYGGGTLRVRTNERADVSEVFATELAATNPKFDRARFLAACRPTGDTD